MFTGGHERPLVETIAPLGATTQDQWLLIKGRPRRKRYTATPLPILIPTATSTGGGGARPPCSEACTP